MISLQSFGRNLVTLTSKRTISTIAPTTTVAARIVPTPTTQTKPSTLPRPLLSTSHTLQYKPNTSHRTFHQTSFNMAGVTFLKTQEQIDEAMAEKGSLMVLDCFATWCGPCKMMEPKMEQMSQKYTDAKFYKFDVDELPDVARSLGVRAMPTFVFFKDGDKVTEVVGANPKAVESAIENNL